MATNTHQPHPCSPQETLNSVCHGTLSASCHPISKSSSSLAAIGRAGSEEKHSGRQELRKSLSSSACQAQLGEANGGRTPSSEWPSPHSEAASVTRTARGASPSNSMQGTSKCMGHFPHVDPCSAPAEATGTRRYPQSYAVANTPSASGTAPQAAGAAEGLGAAVQRSLSDLTCSCKPQTPLPHMETSATYSVMSSSSSHGASTGNAAVLRPRYGSDSYENAPDFQSPVTWVPSLPRDQNVPSSIFDNGAVSHNVSAFTDPGVYCTNVLGSHMPGDNFPNRAMYAQAGIVYSNFAPGMYPPGMMAVHNSTAFPYGVRQEGTIPAYCHSVPIPSVQFIPRLVCSVSESGQGQANPECCPSLPAAGAATLPKLVSSVSESGLDAKRILRCCSARGEHITHAQPYMQPSRAQEERKRTYVVLNSHQDGVHTVMKTKDTWTMTSMDELSWRLQPSLECKDAEVQTLPTKECKSVATSPSVVGEGRPHVFPEVNLEPEVEGEKSPVREVRWDDEGMTWEVYGAAVDPEVLGLAIQKHLEIQIEQFQTEPEELTRKSTEDPPAKDEKRTSLRTMMHCLRSPSCCARSSTAVE